ncbi:MAG: hypothetical protein ACI87O_001395, partial [Planctomycetota bacterium]
DKRRTKHLARLLEEEERVRDPTYLRLIPSGICQKLDQAGRGELHSEPRGVPMTEGA